MGTFECSVKHETAASLVRRESTATTSLDRRSAGVSGPTADGAGHSLPKSESSMRDVAPTFEGAVAVRPLSVRLHYQQQQQQQELQEERRQPQSHRAETRGVHDAGPNPGSGSRAGNARASQFAAAFQVDVSVTNGFERPNLPPMPSQTSGTRALYVNAMAMPSPTLSIPSHQALSMVPGPVVTARHNSTLNSTGTEKPTPLERGVVNRDYHGTALLSSVAPSGTHHRPATETVDSNSLGGGKNHGTDSASNQTVSMMDPNAPIFASTHPATPNVVAPAAPSPVAPPSTLPFPLPSPLSNMSTPTSATTNYSSLTAIQGPVSPSRKKNSTPLHYACRFGHIQVVQTILESALKNGGEELARIEADLVAADWKQMTPVHVAAKHGQEAVVALLVQFAQHRASMLAMAAVSAPAPEANVFARRWLRAVLDAQCGEGATALMLAAQHGHASCVRHLLSARDGVDPTRRTLTRGWTAATFAARYGHAGVLRELIQVTDARGCLGMPPAVQTDAFTWDASDVLDVPDAQDGNTPLMVAAKYGKAESVRQLLLVAAWSRAAAKRPAVNAHAANVNGTDRRSSGCTAWSQ
ncbi:hypothetical protein F1559_000785 [Cyanidiococcus yangmingshanensis]|uniref:Uncharacterized protein n=1 Tax=Cyanidiococcus yangmingshanensis TaxID=2690220 RepID=A0A7J7IFX5_9RHOD|nr:hypothetical protein F1559_000785 [Cyanidiococcus yangmingshanensis]